MTSGEDTNTKPRPRRGPAWAYLVAGALLAPFLRGFVFGLLGLHVADSGVSSFSVALVGVALGWFAYRIFSQPKQPPKPPDYMA